MIFNNYAALHNGMYDSYKDTPADAVAQFGVNTGLALTASFFARYVPTGIPLEKLRYLNEYTMLDPATGTYVAYANWFEKNGGSIKRATASATIKELIWNSIKFAEEQLFKIPRTFSASSYVGMNVMKDFEFVYGANSPTIQNQMKYLEAISEGKINKFTIGEKVKFSGGKLYSIDASGQESVLLKNATAIPFEWGRNTPTKYISKFAKALFEQHGISAPSDIDFMFTGGQSWLKGAKEKLGGFSTAALENYVKLLDDPFGLVREVLDSSGHHLPRVDKFLTKASGLLDKVFLKDLLGVGGFQNMKNRSAMQLLKLHFNKIAPVAILGIGAYKVVNAALQDAFDTDIKGMGAQAYQDVSKGISAVSDYTGLTLLGKAQEELAPGSSKLSALAAIPISMAIMGGTLGAITNTLAKEPIGELAQGPTWFRNAMMNLETKPGTIGEIAEKISLSKLGRSGAYGAMGAIVGAALVAPFIPGALGDQYTLEERKDLYSGEEYVAHKRGRFWEFGCVKEDTPITTNKGIKPIIDVHEGDLVLTHECEWKKVYACVRQSMDNKRLFRVKPYLSDEYIEITGNHEVPSWLYGIIKDRPVYDLIDSEAYVGFPIIKSTKTINRIASLEFGFIPMGYQLGKLIGLYLSYGNSMSVGNTSSHIEFTLNKENYFSRFDIIETMRYVFDKNPIYSSDSDNIILTYHAPSITEWISSLENNLFSETHIFNHCDNNDFYLGILFGAIEYEKATAIYKGSLDSCLFLRNISLNLGIVAEMKKNSDEDNYLLLWRKSEFAKLNNLFGNIDIKINSCYYKDVAFIDNDTFWTKIELVEELEKPEYVYDLAVEDHKTYTTTAFTIHNTSPFEGDQTLFYAPHWTVRAKTDAVKKGIMSEEDYNSQLAYLMKRLVDPYALEKSTDKERPYTYWGASDMGLGIFETLATPILHAFKPTIVAHREAVGKLHPSQLKRSDIYIPDEAEGNDRIKTRGYAREAQDPNNTSTLVGKLLGDIEHVFGIQGYAVDNLKNLFTGGNSPFIPEAVAESSGRMMSANRLFWQMGLGGGASTTEAYRRLNPQRPYETQYIMSAIRNTMPEWIDREDLKYGDPYCVSPDTLIEIGDLSFINADEVSINDTITTHNGNNATVDNIAIRAINNNEKVYSPKITSLSGIKMLFSEDHPIFVCSNILDVKDYKSANKNNIKKQDWQDKLKYEWKKIKDITAGDYVAYPKPKFKSQKIILDLSELLDYPATDRYIYTANENSSLEYYEIIEYLLENGIQRFEWGKRKLLLNQYNWSDIAYESAQNVVKHNKNIPRINRYVEITPNISYLFGLYLAEGYVGNGKLSFALHSSEVELFEKAIIGAKEIDPLLNTNFTTIKNTNGAVGVIYSTVLMKIIYALFGKHAKDKKIPDILSKLDNECMIQMIRGFNDGDGSEFISKGGDYLKHRDTKYYISMKSCNKILLLQIRKILLSFGFVASIIYNKPSVGKKIKSGESWNLVIRGNSAIKLGQMLGYDTPSESRQSATWSYITSDYILLRVIENNQIEYNENVIGYRVDVDNSFCVAGVATHNTSIPYGDIRLPGRGYIALHPELEGLDPEDYPAIHRMNILSDVAPMSAGFYEAKANVENQMAHGELSDGSEQLYDRIMEQRKEIREGPQFDYGGNPVGDYWLTLKQFGRSLPTESLYPLSPVHKFSGPVDPVTDYKSFNVLDKQFKSWDNPLTDYAKPTWNRAIDFFGYGDFTPIETKEHSQLESYFMGLQFAKNKILDSKATEAFKSGQYELASFYRKGLRPTLHGMSPYEDVQDLDALMPDREKGYLEAFMNDPDQSRRVNAAQITTPYMSQALQGQYLKQRLEESRDFERLEEIEADAPAIRGISLNEFTGSQIPDRNFVGYAPGVDLNALKVKTVNRLGQNIRDYSLWREDEISAQLLDKSMGGLSPYNTFDYANREHSAGIYNLQKKLYQLGNRNLNITAVPTSGSSSINFNIKRDDREDMKSLMQQEGYISY